MDVQYNMALTISQPESVASLGEKIYREQLQAILEPKETGRFVAIDVNSGHYFVADSSNEALHKALKEIPGGLFHLMKVGAPAAFTLTSIHRHGNLARPHRRGWPPSASA